MLKLALELKKANIKFRWTIFTDLDLYNQKPFDLEEVVYMKPSYDFWDYIKEADYAVQLSDTEGYSYFKEIFRTSTRELIDYIKDEYNLETKRLVKKDISCTVRRNHNILRELQG